MMPTLQVSLLTSQDSSSHNNNEEFSQEKYNNNFMFPSNNNSSPQTTQTVSTVRSMKDLLNPSNNNTEYNNDISTQKEYPQIIHDKKSQTPTARVLDNTQPDIALSKQDNQSGITLPSISHDILKPPSSNSESSTRLPSIEKNLTDHPQAAIPTIATDIHNAGSMNVSQLINVNAPPQYYQFMMQNPTATYSNVSPSSYPLPNIGLVVPPATNITSSPSTSSPTNSTSSLPAVKELLPNAPLLQQFQMPYGVGAWYPYTAQPNYMQSARPGVPFYGQVQEAIPVMLEAQPVPEEESKKRKSPSTSKKTNSPTMQSSNCQHHPKPDSDPKTVPFQLKFKSKKERPKNGAFEMQWMEHFTTLKQFYEQFGHTNVTRSTPGYKNLGNWVAEQRRKMRRGKLTKEQYELMNSIAFEWDRSYFFKPSVFTNSDEEENGSEEKKFKSDS